MLVPTKPFIEGDSTATDGKNLKSTNLKKIDVPYQKLPPNGNTVKNDIHLCRNVAIPNVLSKRLKNLPNGNTANRTRQKISIFMLIAVKMANSWMTMLQIRNGTNVKPY